MARGETYEEFVAKFDKKQPKTTDDCYTPQEIYNCVADYVADHYGIDRETFVRPFYPGGDYEHEVYTGAVVVDNPPFSMLAKICRFYEANGVRFFLFAPSLTIISSVKNVPGVSVVFPGDLPITYANGARVNTAFVTNLESVPCYRSSRTLAEALRALSPAPKRKRKPRGPSVFTSADLSNLSKRMEFNVARATSPVQKPRGHYGDAIVSPELSKLKEEYGQE